MKFSMVKNLENPYFHTTILGAFTLREYAIFVYTKCSTNEELCFKRVLDVAHLKHKRQFSEYQINYFQI